jgi:hypothetical protein
VLICQPDQSMSVERIRGSFDQIKGKMEAVGFPCRNHFGVEFSRPFQTSELADAIVCSTNALFRHLWVELKGQPMDSNVVGLTEIGDRLFKSSLPDVTPRTDHVRKHVNGECHHKRLRSLEDRIDLHIDIKAQTGF